MTERWTASELERINATRELRIAVARPDGTLRSWTPIWVVCSDDQAYVRTWHRRDTGWYGAALRSHRARIRVDGLEADVTVEDAGGDTPEIQDRIDVAYRDKYGSEGSASMVSGAARASTLRLRAATAPG